MKSQVFVLTSSTDELKGIREKLKPMLEQSGLSTKAQEEMLVCVGEAVTNAIRHSYGCALGKEIRVSYEEFPDKVALKIRDFGQKIDLQRLKAPTLPPTQGGGLGVYFMKTMMDELEYNTAHLQGNELILVKYKKERKTEKTS